ncbi:unnamed protein product, partial [Mesorhabditis belari]|uniref:Uncharacterized protein n=1 Tax=Mesorhabditis belari TaxID=2138241 RepID=A0AAF3F4S3_9BILA
MSPGPSLLPSRPRHSSDDSKPSTSFLKDLLLNEARRHKSDNGKSRVAQIVSRMEKAFTHDSPKIPPLAEPESMSIDEENSLSLRPNESKKPKKSFSRTSTKYLNSIFNKSDKSESDAESKTSRILSLPSLAKPVLLLRRKSEKSDISAASTIDVIPTRGGSVRRSEAIDFEVFRLKKRQSEGSLEGERAAKGKKRLSLRIEERISPAGGNTGNGPPTATPPRQLRLHRGRSNQQVTPLADIVPSSPTKNTQGFSFANFVKAIPKKSISKVQQPKSDSSISIKSIPRIEEPTTSTLPLPKLLKNNEPNRLSIDFENKEEKKRRKSKKLSLGKEEVVLRPLSPIEGTSPTPSIVIRRATPEAVRQRQPTKILRRLGVPIEVDCDPRQDEESESQIHIKTLSVPSIGPTLNQPVEAKEVKEVREIKAEQVRNPDSEDLKFLSQFLRKSSSERRRRRPVQGPRPLSRTMTQVEANLLPPLYENDDGTASQPQESLQSSRRHQRRYQGSHTTSCYTGRKDAAPDATPRRHLIGFLHRTSHLSLTSELSGDASFYLIGHRGRKFDPESTIGSESDARVLSDEDDRGSTTTDFTSVSRQAENMRRRRKQRNFRRPSRASSFSSITESSMSLDVITVTLNMDTVNFLGISIVGQSSARGDNGIYVANIMKGGAVAIDGRIEAGDMILQVNDIAFDNFTNDQAVDVLRDAVARKGPIKLTVAKSFDGGPKSCFTVPRHKLMDEPVRPIDTQAWIRHTNAMRGMPSIIEGSEGAPTPLPGDYQAGIRPGSSSTVTSGSQPGQGTVVHALRLDTQAEKKRVVEAMAMPNSGLEIKNRTWLKIPIPNSFLGSELVDWLLDHVEGLRERKDARKYAEDLLKAKLISHAIKKHTFIEQCYYILGEECADLAHYRSVQAVTDPSSNWQWTAGQSLVPPGGGLPKPQGPHPTQANSMGSTMVRHAGTTNDGTRLYVSGYASMPVSPFPILPRGAGPDIHSQASGGSGSGGSGSDHRRK